MLLVLRYRVLLWDTAMLQSIALGHCFATEYRPGTLLYIEYCSGTLLHYRVLPWDAASAKLQSTALGHCYATEFCHGTLLVLRYRELLWDAATLQSTALGCCCTTEY